LTTCLLSSHAYAAPPVLPSFPTRRSSDLLPDPGKGHRRDLPALLKETPALAVIVDTFEQRTQRPRRRQRAYYSGKKKAHTLKSQDRKSTRLNSSHQIISYAVFCLKKKKTT